MGVKIEVGWPTPIYIKHSNPQPKSKHKILQKATFRPAK